MILYFSATGNSQYVAEQIAKATNDTLVSIRRHLKDENAEFTLKENENIGIVMPTYFQGMPLFLQEFISDMKIVDEGGKHYAYAVSTCGVGYGNSGSEAVLAMQHAGIKLDATYVVHMVDNWIPYFDMNDKEYISKAESTADREMQDVISKVIAHKSTYEEDSLDEKQVQDLIMGYEECRKTSLFTVSDACIGCHKCENQCPVNAIQIIDGKPNWITDKCFLCLGCVHKCPENAIAYTKDTIGHGQYTNPHVKNIA